MSADTIVAVSGAIRDLSMAGVVGALLLIATSIPKDSRAAERAALIGRIASIAWVASALTYSLATYAYIRDSGVDVNRFLQEWWSYSNSVELLQAHRQVIVGALITSVMMALVRGPLLAGWSLIPVAWAIGWLAQTGHAAGSADHHLATSSMFLHLAGATIWVGVIGVVAALRKPLGDHAKDVMIRASRIAIWGAILVTVSGVANAWLRLDSLSEFFTTSYGRVLASKVALMALAIALAAWHRARTFPRLSRADVAARFWRVLSVDVVALVAIMGIAGVLSTRFSGTALISPGLRLKTPVRRKSGVQGIEPTSSRSSAGASVQRAKKRSAGPVASGNSSSLRKSERLIRAAGASRLSSADLASTACTSFEKKGVAFITIPIRPLSPARRAAAARNN